MNTYNIAYSCDANYFPIMKGSIHSLLSNTSSKAIVKVHFIHNGMDEYLLDELKGLVESFGSKLFSYQVSHERLDNIDIKTISVAAYYRIFLSEIIEEDKVLYCDCDTVFLSDVAELFKIDFDGFTALGVEDTVLPKFKREIGLKEDDRYVNSGMLVLDLKKLRDSNFVAKSLHLLKSHEGEYPHHDQGIINNLLRSKIKFVEPKYNLMTTVTLFKNKQILKFFKMKEYYSQECIDICLRNPVMVHYTESFGERPWVKESNHLFLKDFIFHYQSANKRKLEAIDSKKRMKNKIIDTLFKIFPTALFIHLIQLNEKIKVRL